MIRFIENRDGIDTQQWKHLCEESHTATWFQTESCYDFYCKVNDELTPYVFGVEEEENLMGVMLVYVTKSKNAVKHWFTRRGIVIGGPVLAGDISKEALTVLLKGCVKCLMQKAIYIETRNFNDYGHYKSMFESCGFRYQEHLNFKVDTTSVEIVEKNMGKGKKRDIKTSLRDGAKLIEKPTEQQIVDFYALLKHLYKVKVKTPLFGIDFFLHLYDNEDSRFFIVAYNGKVIGGSVAVCLKDRVMYDWFACGKDGESKTIFPSTLSTYYAIRYAAENGYKCFDMMGAGKPNEHYGVRDFKARFGGELVEEGRFLYVCDRFLYWIGKVGVMVLKRL